MRYLRGAPLYLYCAVRQLYRFPGFPVEMAVDGEPGRREDMMMLVIANARVFGGGFRIAPTADLADGQLDAVAFANMPRRRRFPIMLSLLRGTHGAAPEVARCAAPPPSGCASPARPPTRRTASGTARPRASSPSARARPPCACSCPRPA